MNGFHETRKIPKKNLSYCHGFIQDLECLFTERDQVFFEQVFTEYLKAILSRLCKCFLTSSRTVFSRYFWKLEINA